MSELLCSNPDVLMTTPHIGIVACSAPGAALCYETICVEASQLMGRHHNPEVSLHMVDLADHVRFMEQDDWDGVAKLILASAQKLAAIGATFAICPDNTAHPIGRLNRHLSAPDAGLNATLGTRRTETGS